MSAAEDSKTRPRFTIGDQVYFDGTPQRALLVTDCTYREDAPDTYVLLDETLRVTVVAGDDVARLRSMIALYEETQRELERINTAIQALNAIANFLGPRLADQPDPRD